MSKSPHYSLTPKDNIAQDYVVPWILTQFGHKLTTFKRQIWRHRCKSLINVGILSIYESTYNENLDVL